MLKKISLFLLTLATMAQAHGAVINGPLIKAGFEPLTAAPTSVFAGRVYFDSDLVATRVYNGTTWESLPAATGGTFTNATLGGTVTLSAFTTGVIHANSSGLLSSSLIVNADVSGSAAIAYSKLTLTGSIVNADIGASAAIDYSKLNLATSIVNADVNASAAIAYSKLNLATSIVNTDVNGSAAIAYSKLNLATSILNADINASAAIAYSKLNLAASIVNADVNASAAIAYSKLSLTGSIVNTDIGASAAIAFSKLAALTSGNLLVGSAGNVPTSVALSGDASLVASGALTLATVNANVGSFGSSTAIPSFTVNAKGLVTAASTNVVIAPAGTLTGTTLASNVVTSSLTAVGTIATGVWSGTAVGASKGGTGIDTSGSTGIPSLAAGTWSVGALTGDVTSSARVTTVAAIAGTAVSGTTGSGNVMFSASPTTTGTLTAAAITASGNVTVSNNTASRVVTTDGSKVLTSATTTVTQVNYLSAATGTTGTSSTNLVFSASPTFSGTTSFPGSTVIDSSGNIGIGGAAGQKLDVQSSTNIASRIQISTANSFTGAVNIYLANANTTANNTSEIQSTNGNGTSDGSVGFVHTVHSATVPKGAFVVGTANGSTTVSERMRIEPEGFLKFSGGTPTMGACGTSPSISGNDTVGTVTVGTGGVATSCTVTFSATRSSTPKCFVNDTTDTVVPYVSARSTTAFTVTKLTAFTAGAVIDYWCVQ